MNEHDTGCEVVVTRTGMHAVLDHGTGEVMHAVVGPIHESAILYVVPSRLAERLALPHPEPLVLFDVGFGAGSNAIAARRVSEQLPASARRLSLVSFDRTLQAVALATRADNAPLFGFEESACRATQQLLAEGRHESPRTSWRLRVGDVMSTLADEPAASADVVFWDPYSPRSNPTPWGVTAFRALRRVCRAGATVHTYSAATATRSALLLAGFAVGVGVPGGDKQKQTTVAAVDIADLTQPLDRRWLARLERSSAPFPCDAPDDALQQISALPQFQG